ncbi:MAG TPA: hypothetical protein VEV17_12360 [Bryobacteraceae bacterium]|nr:hypothetical protein [Bryobacteraceae bacterium]
MKLRIHGNDVRLRLNQAEVAQFSKTGWLEEVVEFGPGASLSFAIESLSNLPGPRAVFHSNSLRIQLPRGVADDWITTDRVGISAEQPLANGKQLAIVVEKDFKCIHSEHPDPDAYPNPLQEAGKER